MFSWVHIIILSVRLLNFTLTVRIGYSIITDRLIYYKIKYVILTRWKKDEKEFSVKVGDDKSGSLICRIPKPIIKILNNPNSIVFVLEGKKIMIKKGDK